MYALAKYRGEEAGIKASNTRQDMHTPTQTSSELEMSYTKEDFSRDWDEICRMAASDKPDNIHQLVQWEMARTHKALVEYWVQVEKVCGLS